MCSSEPINCLLLSFGLFDLNDVSKICLAVLNELLEATLFVPTCKGVIELIDYPFDEKPCGKDSYEGF
jgi:hypothetical protein